MAADFNEILLYHVQDLEPLVAGAVGEQLLEEVVAILVDHDLTELTIDFSEQELDEVGIGFCQFLL